MRRSGRRSCLQLTGQQRLRAGQPCLRLQAALPMLAVEGGAYSVVVAVPCQVVAATLIPVAVACRAPAATVLLLLWLEGVR